MAKQKPKLSKGKKFKKGKINKIENNLNSSTLNKSVSTYGKTQLRYIVDDTEWFKLKGEPVKKRGLFSDTDESFVKEKSFHASVVNKKNLNLKTKNSGKAKGLFSGSDSDDSIFVNRKLISKPSLKSKRKAKSKKKPLEIIPPKPPKNSLNSETSKSPQNEFPQIEKENFDDLFGWNNKKPKPKRKLKTKASLKAVQPQKAIEKNTSRLGSVETNNIELIKSFSSKERSIVENKNNISFENNPKRSKLDVEDDFKVTTSLDKYENDLNNISVNTKPTTPTKLDTSNNIINTSVIEKLDANVNLRKRRRNRNNDFKIKKGLSVMSFANEPIEANVTLDVFDTSVFFDQNNAGMKSISDHMTLNSFQLKSQLHSTPMIRMRHLSNIREVFHETELNVDCSTVAKQSTPMNFQRKSQFATPGTKFTHNFQPFTPRFQFIPKLFVWSASDVGDSSFSPSLPPREQSNRLNITPLPIASPLLSLTTICRQSKFPKLVIKDIRDKLENISSNQFLEPTSIADQGSLTENSLSFTEKIAARKNVSEKNVSICCRDRVLSACRQIEPSPFEDVIDNETECKKLGEGVFGEVFKCRLHYGDEVAVKVLPIEGDLLVNGEKQKTFSEILPEIVISGQLSLLAYGSQHITHGFIELYKAHCVSGVYPESLLSAWNHFDKLKTSENDHPKVFKEDQLYILLEYLIGGIDMEHFGFHSAAEAVSIIQQTIVALAVAEEQLNFEHRDLHWGNILVQRDTNRSKINFTLHGDSHEIETNGVVSHIIDFTLSRMTKEDCSLFQDLSCDPDLFTGDATQDYQFEIYRMMKKETGNDWSQYCPKTNVFWISYLLEKFINHVKYRYKRRKIHISCMKKLQKLEKTILKFTSCYDLFKNANFFDS